jgi:potassium-dependent mechanosensitive channel
LVLRWLIFFLWLVPALTGGAAAQGTSGAPVVVEAPAFSPEALPKILQEGAAALEREIRDLRPRLSLASEKLTQAGEELNELQIALASLKAVLAVKKPSLAQVEELLATYSNRDAALKSSARDLTREMAELQKSREAELTSHNTLRVQMDVLQAREPALKSPEIRQVYRSYLQLADTQDGLLAQSLDLLGRQRQILEEERQLLAGVLPPLQTLQEAWQAELLQRQARQVPVKEQIVRVWNNLAALPERVRNWFADLSQAESLSAFFWGHLGHLVGLLSFIILMGWSTRRLNRWAIAGFRAWRAATGDLHLMPLFVLGLILIANLFLLGLIFWVGLFCWIFGMLDALPVQLLLYALVTLWGLRLGLQVVQAYFGGRPAGVALPLDAPTARFYRRSLKVFLVYLFLGFLGLKAAALLGFPISSLQFLEHFFQVAMFLWVLWLWRRPQLDRLLPALPDPAWVRRLDVLLVLRGLVLFLLSVIVLADLLGFQNLAGYLAQGAAWTGLAVILLWLLWLVAATILHHALHPADGWAPRRYPGRQEALQRLYALGRGLLSILLGAAVVLWSLYSWGIKPGSLAWAFQWVVWGPVLGPVRLTTLNVGGALLAVYLGLMLSRVLRGLMVVKIFPRTGLDAGVQYTVATTLHYVVLILAVMVALNILGFPLTNLALVAGALGVGIGFGLQNIVNNFLSGLILLFERPIKVGDLLVIDGQWGTVKEIRVRSTIFETFDRCVLIIPNSELVANKVLNWTHYGRGINRLALKVGVSYGSDVGEVTRLLAEVCRANPRVLPEPPPQINFTTLGDSSLDFTIWVHLQTPSERVPVAHELNSAIVETFREHGIKMPFPQRDIHIKEWPGEPEKRGED